MYEDCSSDEEWSRPFKKACATKCWECGKYFRHISDLMVHYTSHSIKATCHMCKITFQRETSLSAHLDNVHYPPICQKCLLCFCNPEELNKHAETKCESNCFESSSQHHSRISNVVPLPNDMETPDETENLGSCVEYVVGEDDQSETEVCEDDDDDDGDGEEGEEEEGETENLGSFVEYVVGEDDQSEKEVYEEDDDEEEDDDSKDDSDEESCSENDLVNIQRSSGPRSTKKNRVFVKRPNFCQMCKKQFQSEQSHNEHLRALYTCKLCDQVFLTKKLFGLHKCSNENNSFFITSLCSNYMPRECKICKGFFVSGKALYRHIWCVHKSVNKKKNKKNRVLSSTNRRTNPQEANLVTTNTDKTGSSVDPCIIINGIDSVTGQSSLSIEKSAPVTNPNTVCTASTKVQSSQGNVVFVQNTLPILTLPQGNQQLTVILQNGTASQPQVLHNTVLLFQPSSAPYVRHFRPILKKPLNTQMTESTSGPSHKSVPSPTVLPTSDISIQEKAHSHDSHISSQPKKPLSPPDTLGLADKQRQSEETAPSQPMPTVLAELNNNSCEEALLKHKNTKCHKVVISHRYRHRGRRSHLCQCGRAFKHRLHPLRHFVQHADTTAYICVGCGKTFTGLQQLARHLKGKHHKTFYRRDNRVFRDHTYSKAVQNCAQPFICDCGLVFFKPSAFIWHQLKNKSK